MNISSKTFLYDQEVYFQNQLLPFFSYSLTIFTQDKILAPATILLIDHRSDGHRPAFIRLFAKYLIKVGYHVVIAFPDREKSEWIEQGLLSEGVGPENFRMVDHDLRAKAVKGEGVFSNAIATFRFWRETGRIVSQIERTQGIRIDNVFFAWLDDYLANYLSPFVIDRIFRWPWSGLYFHPWYLYTQGLANKARSSSIDSVLRSKFCKSIAVHDEFVSDLLSKRTGKPVIVFPEIADSTPPEVDFAIAREIRSLAKGRMSIGLIGLARRKGLLLFARMAMHADATRYFFMLAGPVLWEEYNDEEKEFLKDFIASNNENVYYYPQYLKEGAQLNAVIDALNVLYVVYENFMSSSNFSTKAAIFRKPVLATNRFWIGNVTRKYTMGETIEENNLEDSLRALNLLRENIGSFNFANYPKYLEIHSEENLERTFRQIF
jgi:hypothetical protein